MQLPLDSDTCHVCHQDTFTEWQSSAHAANGIECFDCHMAHTQGLRLGSEEKLCAACHADLETQYAHRPTALRESIVRIATWPRMTKRRPAPWWACRNRRGAIPSPSHPMCVPAATRARSIRLRRRLRPATWPCHQSRINADATGQVSGLQKQIADLQQHVKSLRDVAVVSMGLSLGFGGFLGLLAGIILMTILRKRGER